MATNIVQMKDGSGNNQYPVTSAEAVGMPDGSGNLQTYLNKRVTELNISVLYPTQGIGGTNKYDLAGAIAQVPAGYRTFVGLKITFINNDTSKSETWVYDGGIFTSTSSWKQSNDSEKLIGISNNVHALEDIKSNKDIGKNLFDINSAKENSYYNERGEILESSGYYASLYIPIESDTDYFLSNASTGSAAVNLYLDENANIIESFNTGLSHSPINAKYALLSVNTPKKNAQFEKGSVATDYEPYTQTKRLDIAEVNAQYGYNAYLGVMDNGSEWGKGYYKQDGSIQVDAGYQYKTYPITKGTTKIYTNALTRGAYFILYNEDGGIINSFKPGTNTAIYQYYEIDANTVKIGVSNAVSNVDFVFIGASAINVNEALREVDEKLFDVEKGVLAYNAFMTDITWTKGTNYNAEGQIDNNAAWESAKVKVGLSKIKFNFNIGGARLVFFNIDGGVISTYTKNNNDFVELDVPSECVEIGLSNNWTLQTDPQIQGIGIDRNIKEIDEDIEYLKGKTESLEEQIIYTAFGDSISTDEIVPEDNSHADGLAYPGTLAKLINAKLDRYTIPGSGVASLKQNVFKSSTDASLVTCAYGINDVGKINSQKMQLGDIDEIMGLNLEELESNETFLGMYRYSLESLKNRLTNSNALICCISPVTNYVYDNPDGTRKNQDLIDMRNSIKEFVMRMGGPNAGWFYIDGTEILPWDKLYFIGTDNDPDSTHPNSMGEALMAKGTFNRLPNIQLYVTRK